MATLTTPAGYVAEGRRSGLRVDWGLFVSSCLLLGMGLMSLYSIGAGSQELFFRKQALNVLIGIAPFLIFFSVRPNTWRRGANWLYAINLVALIAVLVVGKRTLGAERWIALPGGIQFQPSELAKLLTVITLSAFYANRLDSVRSLGTFALGFLHVAVPLFLIWRQPHLGAAMVLFVMWCAVSMVAGVNGKHLLGFVGALVILAGMALMVPSVKSKLLPSYQEGRLLGLQSGGKDTRGRNWQTDRAEIAFGVGGVTGVGFLKGEQKQAGFIPLQHDDFIVTVIGEEGGLIGCALLLGAYGFFFYRVFFIMLHAMDPYYKMLAAGVFAVLGFHTFVNLAMVLQIVPVVGLWLPFLSYGGTAIWLCMSCVGLVLSVRRQQRPLLF